MSLHLITGYAGTEHITAADQGSFNIAVMGDGEFVLNRGNKFSASIISNNVVKVLDGDFIMQGRHIRLNEDTYVELNFDNGAQGLLRNDLIVIRYTKDPTTGIEGCSFEVLKGTAVESNPADPEYITGDLINEHTLLNEIPIYRVPFDGINMQELVPLFSVVPVLKSEVDSKEPKITAHGSTATSDNYYYGGRKTWIDLLAKVRGTVLTGLSTATQTAITATDTVLTALGKLQAQITQNKVDITLRATTDSVTQGLATKAPTYHASTAIPTYGGATSELCGHVKLMDDINSNLGEPYSFAATPKAVKTAYDKGAEALSKATLAMPMTGGQFTDKVSARNISAEGLVLRNIRVMDSTGTSVPTLWIDMVRK